MNIFLKLFTYFCTLFGFLVTSVNYVIQMFLKMCHGKHVLLHHSTVMEKRLLNLNGRAQCTRARVLNLV